MKKKKTGIPPIAIEDLADALQILPVKRTVKKKDGRGIGKTQRLIGELEILASPSDIARQIGISTAKYGAMKRAIQNGEIGDPVLNALLEKTIHDIYHTPRKKEEDYILDSKKTGRRQQEKLDVWEVSYEWQKKNIKHARPLKMFVSKRSAMNWLGNAGAGAQYLFIVVKKIEKKGKKKTRLEYWVYDMRTPAELAKHGELKRKKKRQILRAEKILEKYGKGKKQDEHKKRARKSGRGTRR